MKAIILLLMTLISVSAFSQRTGEPTFYLDSEKVEFNKVFIHPQSIDSIRVNKLITNGEIHIYSKNNEISFLTLNDILKEYTDLNSLNDSILFRINGEIINDISGIKIDKSYFIYVNVTSASKTKYLSEIFQGLKIVEINLETEKRKPKIIIRGNEELLEITDKHNK